MPDYFEISIWKKPESVCVPASVPAKDAHLISIDERSLQIPVTAASGPRSATVCRLLWNASAARSKRASSRIRSYVSARAPSAEARIGARHASSVARTLRWRGSSLRRDGRVLAGSTGSAVASAAARAKTCCDAARTICSLPLPHLSEHDPVRLRVRGHGWGDAIIDQCAALMYQQPGARKQQRHFL
jgi:hypothetical protein